MTPSSVVEMYYATLKTDVVNSSEILLSTKLHGVIPEKTAICTVTDMRNSTTTRKSEILLYNIPFETDVFTLCAEQSLRYTASLYLCSTLNRGILDLGPFEML